MFVKVRLLKGYQKILTYKIPDGWETDNLIGSVISVPIRNRTTQAVVLGIEKSSGNVRFDIKEAIARDLMPEDELYHEFASKLSKFYFLDPEFFYKRFRGFFNVVKTKEPKISGKLENEIISKNVVLTDSQNQVVDYSSKFLNKPKYEPILVHGVTGSGKTEIYRELIQKNFELGKTTILLLPEVSLSLQFQNIFEKRFGDEIPIIGFHSASTKREKDILWKYLIDKKPCLIVGVHLPIILPIPNLGLIIIDEEHETGFIEKKHPKINSKEVAIWRAKIYGIPIILGSATPSINSLNNIEKYNWKLFSLTERFSGKFPEVKIVKLTPMKGRRNFWITRELESEIRNRLTKKEQIIIYINRRGYSFFVQCKSCGFTFLCPHCSVSLTVHKESNLEKLSCHYCDYEKQMPIFCEECKAPSKELIKKGIGTQQVVSILEKIFPLAKIDRVDLDTTKKKKCWHQTVEKFEKGEIDILVGTQTITKGYHFPNVTLIGILWADLNLSLPLFNARERALQQLIQVAGRSGRGINKDGLVIAQVMEEHAIFDYLEEEKYLNFYEDELEFRRKFLYPPFCRFVQIEIRNSDVLQIESDSKKLYEEISLINKSKNLDLKILGPSKPMVYKIQKTEIRHIFLKADLYTKFHSLVSSINLEKYQSRIFITPS